MESNWIVYIHICPNDKKYIGITSKEKPNHRWRNGEGYKSNKHFYNAIKKYGWDNIEHIVIENNLSKEDAQLKEIELISKYNSNNQEFGYNAASGGEANSGYKQSEEHKRKISVANSGANHGMSKMIICITTGEIFDTISEAVEKYNIDSSTLSRCLKGKIQYAGKLKTSKNSIGKKLVWKYC